MPANQPLYLALDQGGSQSRALVIDARGRVVSAAARPVATRRRGTHQVEQAPEQLRHTLHETAAEAVASLSAEQRTQLVSCGLACQRSSLLAWDSVARHPLTPVLSWQDCRGATLMPDDPEQIASIRRISGLFPSAHHGASKMAWLLRQHQGTQRAAARNRLQLLPLASYLSQALFGRLALDPANAQRTLLWDFRQRDWSPQLLARFGVERRWLPPLAPSLSDWGGLALPGLTLPCRLIAGDQSVAPLAGGAVSDGSIQINLGSGGFLCTPDHEYSANRLLQSVAYSRAGCETRWLEGTVNGAGAALQWLEQQPPSATSPKVSPPRRAPTSTPTALFLNAVGGLGSPFWRTDRQSRFLGNPTADRRQAVLESLLFLLMENLDAMRAAGAPVENLRLSGGLSRSAGVAQRLANLSGLPVTQNPQPEATARGLVWLLAGQPQDWSDEPEQTFQPQADRSLNNRYRRWRRAMGYWLAQQG